MKNVSKNFCFFVLTVLAFSLLTSGCSTPTTLVKYPALPQQSKTIDFKIHDMPITKFVAENGKNFITKDNVTVTVEDIAEATTDDRFSTTFMGPDEVEYQAGITPMMLVLKIKNDTNHILTLRQTIIKIEDENLLDYPLISTVPESKGELINKVQAAFDRYLHEIDLFFKEAILNNAEYRKDYEKFVADLYAAHAKGQVKTQDQKEGYVVTETGLGTYKKIRSPEYLYDENLQTHRNRTMQLRGEAIQKISKDIDNNISNIITSGHYPPISLLPGRTTKIVVPFNSRTKNESISELYVNIFDMPTVVDAASNPTKRAHFNFKLVATH